MLTIIFSSMWFNRMYVCTCEINMGYHCLWHTTFYLTTCSQIAYICRQQVASVIGCPWKGRRHCGKKENGSIVGKKKMQFSGIFSFSHNASKWPLPKSFFKLVILRENVDAVIKETFIRSDSSVQKVVFVSFNKGYFPFLQIFSCVCKTYLISHRYHNIEMCITVHTSWMSNINVLFYLCEL